MPKSIPPEPSPPIVVLLGEAHDRDRNEIYSYMEAKNPDLILLEIPTELIPEPNKPLDNELKAHLEEHSIGWKFCQARAVPCLGFDMQGNDLFNTATHLPMRQEKFAKAFVEFVKLADPKFHDSLMLIFKRAECGDDLKQRNEESCDRLVEEKRRALLSAVGRFKNDRRFLRLKDQGVLELGDSAWQRRNQAMAQNICKTTQHLGGKTTVVIVGSDHRYILRSMLKNCAIQLRDPTFN